MARIALRAPAVSENPKATMIIHGRRSSDEPLVVEEIYTVREERLLKTANLIVGRRKSEDGLVVEEFSGEWLLVKMKELNRHFPRFERSGLVGETCGPLKTVNGRLLLPVSRESGNSRHVFRTSDVLSYVFDSEKGQLRIADKYTEYVFEMI